MCKKINFMMFILGATIGSIVTRCYIKKKYEQITQEEINSVKSVFSKRKIDFFEEPEDEEKVEKWVREKEEVEKEHITIDKKPHVITPEEFGEFDDYEKISLTYYADKILADDNDESIEDVEDVVGLVSLNSFGEYEDDSVFVRNDRLKCDYEILLDQRKFSKVRKRKPHEVDD